MSLKSISRVASITVAFWIISTGIAQAEDDNTNTGWLGPTITVNGFRRGDTNGDGQLGPADHALLLAYLYPNGIPGPAPVNCVGGEELDAGDVNDNEHCTIADVVLLRDQLACGAGSIASPDNCGGTDPDDGTAGFEVIDDGYYVSAWTLDVTGAQN